MLVDRKPRTIHGRSQNNTKYPSTGGNAQTAQMDGQRIRRSGGGGFHPESSSAMGGGGVKGLSGDGTSFQSFSTGAVVFQPPVNRDCGCQPPYVTARKTATIQIATSTT
jgi:hypothetical protein